MDGDHSYVSEVVSTTRKSGTCIICCLVSDEKLVKVVSAINIIKSSAEIRQDCDLVNYIEKSPPNEVHVIHESCRKSFTRSLSLAKLQDSKTESASKRKLRSQTPLFNWKENCILCGLICDKESSGKFKRRKVEAEKTEMTLFSACKERNDEWAHEVLGRLECCNDLMAADAIYHVGCHSRFYVGLTSEPGIKQPGRPVNQKSEIAYFELCRQLENAEANMYTLNDLQDIMSSYVSSDDLYSTKYLKKRLEKTYGSHIYFAEVNGRRNVISFKDMVSHIVSDKWFEGQDDDSTKAENIIKCAARLVSAQIHEMLFENDKYPCSDDLKKEDDTVVPPLLCKFLKHLLKDSLKINGIGQSIVQGCRPSVILPLQFGLSVMLDKYGSTELIKGVSRLGFCMSCDELVRFKQSVMQSSNSDDLTNPINNSFMQFIGDNVDHNVKTLDGSGTLHAMGIISATVLPPGKFGSHCVPRLQSRLCKADLCRDESISTLLYSKSPGTGLSQIHFTKLSAASLQQLLPLVPDVRLLNTLWNVAGAICPDDRMSWSGYMQSVCVGDHPSVASVTMLPILNMNPTDYTCIYSTLLFISRQAKSLHVLTPTITFDQPLFLKATDIVLSEKLNIVVRLGGFHTMMTFLGALGSLMKGSGLEDILGTVYGKNVVEQIMTGKPYDRALRAHFLVASALTKILVEFILSPDSVGDSVWLTEDDHNTDMNCISEDDKTELVALFKSILKNKVKLSQSGPLTIDSDVLRLIQDKLGDLENVLSALSRTSRYWILYLRYVNVLKIFLIAERTSNWLLHLDALRAMIDLFAATGRYNYAKSARLYLQIMADLPEQYPWLYDQFIQGYHTIRRSDRYWAGLSCDLVIEQTMMRSIKSRCGLTHGRGVGESVQIMWIKTMAERAQVNLVMSEVLGLSRPSSEHVELGATRSARDREDLDKIANVLKHSSPFRFADHDRLVNITSGVSAGPQDKVNCEIADQVGSEIQSTWDNNKYTEITFKKSSQIQTLSTIFETYKLDDSNNTVDSSNLFHRLVVLAHCSTDVAACFDYELSPYPTSLFTNGLMRKPDKPSLYKSFAKGFMDETLPYPAVYVVDGGCLMNRVRWMKGKVFSDVVEAYVVFVERHFRTSATVVFDGYDCGPTVKDHEHLRRLRKTSKVSPSIHAEMKTAIAFDQDSFLSNPSNKQQLINAVSDQLRQRGICVKQAEGDADTDIVSVALQLAKDTNVIVYADDTDVLALLLYHRHSSMMPIYFLSEAKGKKKATDCGKCINIGKLQLELGEHSCRAMLVVHSFGGCDTTSSIFGIGKSTVYSRLVSNPDLARHIALLQNQEASIESVKEAGVAIMIALYNGKNCESLGQLRFKIYSKLVTNNFGHFQVERLPPSVNAAEFHALRVHYQAVVWGSLGNCSMDPIQWGWKLKDNRLMPITMSEKPGPKHLMEVVRCNCASEKMCSSKLCSCVKNGLHCISACGNCHGTDCVNADQETEAMPSSTVDYSPSDDSLVSADGSTGLDYFVDSNMEAELATFLEETI